MSNYYVGNSGVPIILTVGTEDISSASVMKIAYKKPSGVTGEWDAELGPQTATGEYTSIMYIVQPGDWDEPGSWTLQAYLEIGDFKGYGDAVKFKLSAMYT